MTDDKPRIGDWTITASGGRFWPLDPRADEVNFDDIAHALAHICRYGGHSIAFYSVAEHSIAMAGYFARRGRVDLARWALLHVLAAVVLAALGLVAVATWAATVLPR